MYRLSNLNIWWLVPLPNDVVRLGLSILFAIEVRKATENMPVQQLLLLKGHGLYNIQTRKTEETKC